MTVKRPAGEPVIAPGDGVWHSKHVVCQKIRMSSLKQNRKSERHARTRRAWHECKSPNDKEVRARGLLLRISISSYTQSERGCAGDGYADSAPAHMDLCRQPAGDLFLQDNSASVCVPCVHDAVAGGSEEARCRRRALIQRELLNNHRCG